MSVKKMESVDVSKITLGKVEDNLFIKSQKQVLINYDNDTFLIQTPYIVVESYGIPSQSNFYTTAKSRSFFKMPFCHDRRQMDDIDYDAIKQMFEKFQEIDNYFSSKEIRIKLFGEKSVDKYEYQPLLRYPDETEENNKYYRPVYTKIKLDLDYQTEKPKYKLFNNVNGARSEVILKTFDDTLKYLKYLTKVRFVIFVHKLYINKTSMGTDKKKFGIILRAKCVETINRFKPDKMNEIMFQDDDDEEAIED
jgi:hypothetical protein